MFAFYIQEHQHPLLYFFMLAVSLIVMINWSENFSMGYNSIKVGTALFKVRTKVEEISEDKFNFSHSI